MSRLEDRPTEIIEPPAENGSVPDRTPPSSSLLGQLRGMRAEAAADKHFDLEVPGYRGCLVLRLGPLGGSVITKLRERADKSNSPDKDFNANADVLIAGTREVLGRPDREAELEPLDPDGGTVRVDERLAELLQLGTKTARASLLELWDKANAPEIAVGLAAAEYIDWCGDTSTELDEEFVGKA